MATILDLLSQDGITVRRIASTGGGEYSGPCLLCGGRDRFRCWPEEGHGGKWWCRGCEKGGDCVQYLIDMRNMKYLEACDFLGQEPKQGKRSFDWNGKQDNKNNTQWEPREIIPPSDMWVQKCMALIDWCQDQLWGEDGKDTLEWLKTERGLSEKTIKDSRLGWNLKDLWRERIDWGLEPELKENGKPKKLWLPGGIIIPRFVRGKLQGVRVRRFNSEKGPCFDPEIGPKYYIIPGSGMGPMVLGEIQQVLIIVESELDGILLHRKIGDMAGVIAMGSVKSRPDKATTELLRKADLILVALDNDEGKVNGKNPGAQEALNWWLKQFSQGILLPPVYGKDPAEMLKAGVDLREWVEIGIEIDLASELSDQDSEEDRQGHDDEQPPETVPHNSESDPNGGANVGFCGVVEPEKVKNIEPEQIRADEPPPEEIEIKVADLEQCIIDALQGRPLPIKISKAGKIIDLEKYARAESRDAFHPSTWVRNAARARLALLGVEINLEGEKDEKR